MAVSFHLKAVGTSEASPCLVYLRVPFVIPSAKVYISPRKTWRYPDPTLLKTYHNIIAVSSDKLKLPKMHAYRPGRDSSNGVQRDIQLSIATRRPRRLLGVSFVLMPCIYWQERGVDQFPTYFPHVGLSPNLPSAKVGTRIPLFRRNTVPFLRTVCAGTSPLAICRS